MQGVFILRKIIVALSAILLVICLWFSVTPVFFRCTDSLEISLGNSSSAKLVRVTALESLFINNIQGESFKVEVDKFDFNNFIKEFNASVVLVEKTEQGVGYYAYSPTIRYKESIKGRTVNLHIFIAEKEVTVGTPIIYGGF